MAELKLLSRLGKKGADIEAIAERVVGQPELLSEVVEGLSSDNARTRYGSAKVLRLISEQSPVTLYPQLDRFIALLGSDNKLLQWTAILIVANLAGVDLKKKIEKVLAKYFEPIQGSVLITAANVIRSAPKIALAKPELADRIAKELLKVEGAQYQSTECRNVALGHTIKTLTSD